MSRQLSTTRPFPRRWSSGPHPDIHISEMGGHRPLPGGALTMAPLPVTGPGGLWWAGMDPSDPATWVRPWNPQAGMISRLNFDGAGASMRAPVGGLIRQSQQKRRG
jgi:hypothetical protein